MEALNTMEANGFNTVAGRAANKEVFTKIPRVKPFSRTEQFDEFATLLYLDGGDYTQKRTQLLGALEYKDSARAPEQENAKDDKKPGNGNGGDQQQRSKSDNDVRNFNSYDNAQKAFYESLRRYRAQINMQDSVYDRTKLETTLNLRWT